jgi:hypothetical protein
MDKNEAVSTYLSAYTAAQEAAMAVAKLMESVREISQPLLHNWRSVILPGIVMHGSRERGSEVNLSRWPTSEQLHKAISEWHSKRRYVDQTWRNVPAEAQQGLKDPQTLD